MSLDFDGRQLEEWKTGHSTAGNSRDACGDGKRTTAVWQAESTFIRI